MEPTDFDPVTAAYHEAGHVLIAHLLRARVVFASIEPEDATEELMGRTQVEWPQHDVNERRRCSALVALAGPCAESHWRGDVGMLEDHSSWRQDWAEVEPALIAAAAPAEREVLLRRWLLEIRLRFEDPAIWERLCRIADALEAHGSLDEALLDELLQGY